MERLQKREKLAKYLLTGSWKEFSSLDTSKMGGFQVLKFGFVSRKLCGESSAVVNTDAIEMWFEKLPKILEGYKDCDMYNADEIGLFYKCLPEKTLAFKGEFCHGGEYSKPKKDLQSYYAQIRIVLINEYPSKLVNLLDLDAST